MKQFKRDFAFLTSVCLFCKRTYEPKRYYRNKYCSQKCRNESQHTGLEFPTLNSGSVGSINELRVCIDLLAKGWEVYRSISPDSKHDLVITKDGKTITVQVTTGKNLLTGERPIYRQHSSLLLATVFRGEIVYSPSTF